MLAGQIVTGDRLCTEDLHLLPDGTMVKSLRDFGWWEVTEVPQVETVSERDQLAMELRDLVFIHGTHNGPPQEAFLRQADYVLANFTPAETAVAEVVADAQVVNYPQQVRDADGDLWKLTGVGRYTWVGGLPGQVNTTNINLADLVVNFGPIRSA